MRCSRSSSQRGFTLIELIVVVSIIGLVASIILGSLQGGRTKADNASRVRVVQEYKKALDFAYDADGYFPGFSSPPILNPGEYYCLGDYGTDTCQYGLLTTGTESSFLNQSLARFILQRVSMKPINQNSIFFGAFRWDGPVYVCSSYLFPDCLSLSMQWVMHGSDAECGFGITATPSSIGSKSTGGNLTVCTLYLR